MSLLVPTLNDVPRWRVERVLAEVTGLPVRWRNVGAQIGAGLETIVGGELRGLTKQLQQSRDPALERLVQASAARGANAVLAMRSDSSEVGGGYQEIVANGTAEVVVAQSSPLSPRRSTRRRPARARAGLTPAEDRPAPRPPGRRRG